MALEEPLRTSRDDAENNVKNSKAYYRIGHNFEAGHHNRPINLNIPATSGRQDPPNDSTPLREVKKYSLMDKRRWELEGGVDEISNGDNGSGKLKRPSNSRSEGTGKRGQGVEPTTSN